MRYGAGRLFVAEHYWNLIDVAKRLDITAAGAAVAKLPEPDVWVGETRGWKPETIEAWILPGSGNWGRKSKPPRRDSDE
jgi:hypothetical protein